MQVALIIPDDLPFDALKLDRLPDGSLEFDWSVIRRICEASMLSEAHFRDASEDNTAGLLLAWYQQHREQGGAENAIMEELYREIQREDAF